MRTVDRGGVHIEQCSQCRGVFLDAGELEGIVAAENRFYDVPPPYVGPEGVRPAAPPPAARYPDSPKPYRGGYCDSPPPHGRRRKSFLEQLFD